VDLFEAVLSGDAAGAISVFRELYNGGSDAAVVLADVAEFVHFVTRVKLTPAALEDPSVTEVERLRGKSFADQLSHRVLARAWQILSKGITEVQAAPKPAQAADMVLVRLAYAADLPTPDEALRMLRDGSGAAPSGNAAPSSRPSVGGASMQGSAALAVATRTADPVPSSAPRASVEAAPVLRLDSFTQALALADQHRDIQLKTALERDVRLVRFEDGRLEFRPSGGASPGLASDIQRKLSAWTGRRWVVAVSSEEGEATIRETAEAARETQLIGVRANPEVQAILARFPGAEIIGVRTLAPPEAPVEAAPIEDDEDEE
jgi:DNA polymerase-3 subunit gamma/tau